MPHRTALPALLALALAAAGCASGASSPVESGDPSDATSPGAPAADSPGIRAGWISFKSAEKRGQLMNQTLVGASTREGKLIATGRARMDGGKVIDDKSMAEFVDSVSQLTDFFRYAVRCDPNSPPAGALAVAWVDRGDGFVSLFLMPGAVRDSSTAGAPKAYEAFKALVFTIHQRTPGSSVTIGNGWSGEELLNQKPGEIHR